MNSKQLKYISVIPVVSTIVIFFVTLNKLKRQNASCKKWLFFNLIWFVSGITMCIVGALFKYISFPLLQAVVMWLIMVVTNLAFIQILIDPSTTPEKKQVKFLTIKHKAVLFILIPSAILSLLVSYLFMVEMSPSYPDNNGASDTSLCAIEIDEIINTANNFSALGIYESYTGEKTNVIGELEYADYDNITFACKKVDGITTLQATKVMSDTISIIIDSTVTAGNAEIIILVDNEYYCHVDTGCIQPVEINNISEKTIAVRLAAESAELNVTIKRNIE